MPELVDHVAHLSQDIGPRPAGTEEEQHAALYIAEHLQKEAGFAAQVEEFNATTDADVPRMICSAIALLAVLIALVIPQIGVLSLLLGIVAAVLYGAEVLDKPLLSKVLPKGVSQNVVAKYEPGVPADGNPRRRKVILVAHYDSGKVAAERSGFLGKQRHTLQVASMAGLVLVPVLVLIRNLLFGDVVGAVRVVFTVLLVIAALASIIPLIIGVLHRMAPYNDGANCNAAGTAVLLDVAKRIGRGRLSEEEYAEREAVIHGEEAARAEGLVPEGAEIVYEAQGIKPPEPPAQSEEERLAMAKAAIAALTGKPVEGAAPVADISKVLVQVHERTAAPVDPEQGEVSSDQDGAADAAPHRATYTPPAEPEITRVLRHAVETVEAAHPVRPVVPADASARSAAAELQNRSDEVPDWFTKAQERAKKPLTSVKSSQRSRFTTALDAAAVESAGSFAPAAAEAAEPVEQEAPEAAAAPVEHVSEVQVPQWAPVEEDADQSIESTSKTSETAEAAPAVDAAPAPVEEPVSDDAPAAAPEVGATVAFAPIPVEEIAASVEAVEDKAPVAAQPVVDELGTADFAPLDVSDLRAGTVPPVREVSQPAFLDFAPAQASQPDDAVTPPASEPVSSAAADEEPVAATIDPVEDADEIAVEPLSAHEQPLVAPEPDSPAEPEAARTDEAPSIDASAAFNAMNERPVNTESPETTLDFASIDLEPAAPIGHATVEEPHAHRRPIALPNIGVSAAAPAPIAEKSQQRAPLAEVEHSGQAAAKSLLTMLPSISAAEQRADDPNADAPSRTSLTSLPTLSGSLGRPVNGDAKSSSVATAGSFVSAAATGSFAPVGDELLKDVDPDDIYVDDADDSAYEEQFTETGAFAGPGYVEMPKSRIHRLFDRFRPSKDDAEPTPQEWLDVDEDFDARTVGKERGGWESFREDQEPVADQAYNDEGIDEPADQTQVIDPYTAPEPIDEQRRQRDDHSWNGGAFSPKRLLNRALGKNEDATEAPARADEPAQSASVDAEPADEQGVDGGTIAMAPIDVSELKLDTAPDAPAGADEVAEKVDDVLAANDAAAAVAGADEVSAEPVAAESVEPFASEPTDAPDTVEALEEIAQLNAELAQVHHFRNPDIDTEVWFVALGSELADNNGMRAFLEAHGQDMRGAIVIDLDALGAGDLSLVDREGALKVVKTSSRMKRYLKKATAATGTAFSTVSLPGNESTASFAIKHGVQAMHLVGTEQGLPAHAGRADDVLDNVDPDLLAERADYVMELVKNI